MGDSHVYCTAKQVTFPGSYATVCSAFFRTMLIHDLYSRSDLTVCWTRWVFILSGFPLIVFIRLPLVTRWTVPLSEAPGRSCYLLEFWSCCAWLLITRPLPVAQNFWHSCCHFFGQLLLIGLLWIDYPLIRPDHILFYNTFNPVLTQNFTVWGCKTHLKYCYTVIEPIWEYLQVVCTFNHFNCKVEKQGERAFCGEPR